MIKNIKKSDVSWRNLPLLTKFLTPMGKIPNKYQTRLPTPIHRKFARAVKQARHMGFLPFVEQLKPYDKIPLTSTFNDFVDDISKVVDKKSGTIKMMPNLSLQDKFSYSNYSDSSEAHKANLDRLEAEKFKNTLKLEKSEVPILPDLEQRELLLAQNYLIKLKENSIDFDNMSLLDKQEKSAHEKVFKIISKNFNPSSLIESFINEKGYNISHVIILYKCELIS